MKGTIRAKGKDTWQISFYTGKLVDGKRERYFETVHAHRKSDAQLVLNERLVGKEKNVSLPKGRLTVAEQLNNWFNGYVKTNCGDRTIQGYKIIIDRHLIPALGHIKLRDLQPVTIQNYYGKACDSVSARTVHHIHRVLSESLKYAFRQGDIGRNPCEMVDPPRPVKINMRTLTTTEVKILLDAAKDSQYYPVIYTAVNTGLRRSELLGLRWRDISFDNGKPSISVNRVLYKGQGVIDYKEPKTPHSRRRVEMTPNLAEFLKGYQAQQEALYIINAKKLSLDSLVFGKINARPVDPSVLSHEFAKIVKRANLGEVHFHSLRHTWASLMLLLGVSPKVISEALGHSSVAFTMDTYSHIIEGMQSNAMELLNGVLPKGVISEINAKLTPNPAVMSNDN
jgi:integrase